MQPYKDSSNIRTFSKDVDPMELVWHQDDEDRKIEILEGEGWCKFNEIICYPERLVKGETIFITKGEIHRVHKGTTDLKIRING